MKLHLKALIIVISLGIVGGWAFNHFYFSKLKTTVVNTGSIEEWETSGLPGFEAKTLDGKTVQLSSFAGKIVILNFWASWCGPCIEEVPSLIKLVKEFKGEIQLVAISGDSNRNDIDIFLKSFPEFKGENITLIWDEDRSLMKTFGITRLPESLISDRKHRLAKKLVGSIDWHTQGSVDYLNTLMSKQD